MSTLNQCLLHDEGKDVYNYSYSENAPCLNTAATTSTRAASADFPIAGCSRIVSCLVFSCDLICTTG